jgi:pimeloyl-ACP methyl ester carboxylesterase
VRVNYQHVANLWHRLMRGLGYERYGAQGGDFGAGITTFMALTDPRPMMGVHLSNLELTPYTGPGSRPLSAAEKTYLERNEAFWQAEYGYKAIQSTKPQTLGYGLNDSPAGLAAWILEKWRSWADSRGNLDKRFSRDFLLTTVTLYWVTQTITSSMRDYFDNDNRRFRVTLGPQEFVSVPTGIAVFANTFVDEGTPPREWAERLYNVQRWTPMPRGGHFAPAEEPELVARDIAALFAGL